MMRAGAVKAQWPAARDEPMPSRTSEKTPIGIQALLHWAFGRELTSIDFEDRVAAVQPSVGMEYVIMQRALLFDADHFPGRIDGGGSSPCHDDADLVASAVAMMPEKYGGRRMALIVMDHARSDTVPDCMIGAKPRLVPVGWKTNRHGARAQVETIGKVRWVSRGRQRERQVQWCPIRYAPHAKDIAAARRRYLQWCMALLYLRSVLQSADLSGWRLTEALPPVRPWEKSS